MAKSYDKILSPIKARVEQYVVSQSLNKEDFYKKIGVASSNFRGKGGLSELGGEAIAKILSLHPDLNSDWLLTGKGEMIRVAQAGLVEDQESVTKRKGTPLVRTEALGGLGSASFAIEENDILARYVVPDFENIDFMLRVRGNSMAPKYNSGDVVACRILKERAFIQWNMAHVIATDEQGILIKRLKQGSTPEFILAVSDNKDYDPFEVPWAEVKGIALVVGFIGLE